MVAHDRRPYRNDAAVQKSLVRRCKILVEGGWCPTCGSDKTDVEVDMKRSGSANVLKLSLSSLCPRWDAVSPIKEIVMSREVIVSLWRVKKKRL